MGEAIDIQVECGDGVTELMHLTPLGDQRYRVEDQPVCAESISVFDIIEGKLDESNTLRGVRIVTKSGWNSQCFGLSKECVETKLSKIDAFINTVIEKGGRCDRVMGGLLLVSLPPTTDYDPADDFEKLFN